IDAVSIDSESELITPSAGEGYNYKPKKRNENIGGPHSGSARLLCGRLIALLSVSCAVLVLLLTALAPEHLRGLPHIHTMRFHFEKHADTIRREGFAVFLQTFTAAQSAMLLGKEERLNEYKIKSLIKELKGRADKYIQQYPDKTNYATVYVPNADGVQEPATVREYRKCLQGFFGEETKVGFSAAGEYSLQHCLQAGVNDETCDQGWEFASLIENVEMTCGEKTEGRSSGGASLYATQRDKGKLLSNAEQWASMFFFRVTFGPVCWTLGTDTSWIT
ncbi:unnamed protein product, partial [Amoebophrya sp. A25]